ncbi:MAG: methyl-accepting chemotaxis protein [Gaiellaceae bacterium]
MRRVLDALLAPAVGVTARFAMVWKIALVCAVLLVPTVILGNGYRSGMAAQTSFAGSERAGIRYARPLMGLLASTVELRSAEVRTSLGEPAGVTRAAVARAAIDTGVRNVDAIAAQKPGGLDLSKQWPDARAAVTSFAARTPGRSPAAELAAADAALSTINAALMETLTASNLILDPDLDAYSVMDAWLLRTPVVLDIATRSSSDVAVALAHGSRADRRLAVDLAAASARLNDALAAIAVDRSAVQTSTRDGDAAREVSAPLGLLSDSLGRLGDTLSAGMSGTPLPRAGANDGELVAAAARRLSASYPVTLDRLLRERSARLNGVLYRDFLITAIFLLFAAYLVAAVVLQIRRGIGPIVQRLGSLVERCTTDLRRGLEAMARGDLTVAVSPSTPPIEQVSKDELGRVAEAVNGIQEQTAASVEAYNRTRTTLSELIGNVQSASGTVSSASQQIATTSGESQRAVGEIASAVGEVASGAERQVQMIEHARQSAEETAAQVGAAHEVALAGVQSAHQVSQAMEAVRESSSTVTEAMRGLASKSEQIGGIVETITGIAGQTNLLALNAAIEAARAGEQGRGFAVVAEEVRKLAEESEQAAGKIAGLIAEIQTATQRTVVVVDDGARRTEDGVAVVQQAREAFEQIGAQVEQVTSRIAEILNATVEVAAVAEQSSASTEQLSASTEQTSASAQQIAASAEELAATAGLLQELVDTFKVAAAADALAA